MISKKRILHSLIVVAAAFIPSLIKAQTNPIIIGSISASTEILDIDVPLHAKASISLQTSTATLKTRSQAIITILEKDVNSILRKMVESLDLATPGPCSVAISRIESLETTIVHYAIEANVGLAISSQCGFLPDHIKLKLSVSPLVRKGGVLKLSLNRADVDLPSSWSILDRAVAKHLQIYISDKLKELSIKIPPTEVGIFALQGIRLEQQDDLFVVNVSLDGLQTSEQLTKLLNGFLTTHTFVYPKKQDQ